MMTSRGESTLDEMRVLITRPSGRADELMTAIAARGGRAVHIPLLDVAGLDEQRDAEVWLRTKASVLELDRYDRVIAISVNAVHYGLQWIGNYWPQLPTGIAWYGIGAATVAEFARFDIVAHTGSGQNGVVPMNSEALLALPELQRVDGERMLILRGIGGRETLADALRARGARVDYGECYRRVDPVLDDAARAELRRLEFDAVCVNSSETLMNFWEHLDEAARLRLQDRALVVPSVRVAALAHSLGLRRVITAANAGTEATISALQALRCRT